MQSVIRHILSTYQILSVALLILLCPSVIHAATPYTPTHPDPILEQWRWRSFPELSGLGLLCLTEDRDKNMWFGLRNGVRKYDGLTWTEYTPLDGLPGAPVFALCAARDGSLYAGTNHGIGHFKNNTWKQIIPLPGDTTHWMVQNIIESADGSIWATTAWGALKLNNEKATLYTTTETANSLKEQNPWLSFVTIPDRIASQNKWKDGIGAHIAKISFHNSIRHNIIVALAPNGPAMAAGLQIGDKILL